MLSQQYFTLVVDPKDREVTIDLDNIWESNQAVALLLGRQGQKRIGCLVKNACLVVDNFIYRIAATGCLLWVRYGQSAVVDSEGPVIQIGLLLIYQRKVDGHLRLDEAAVYCSVSLELSHVSSDNVVWTAAIHYYSL